MMRLKEERFNYTETDELQALELPYKGKDLSMVILLPKEKNLGAVEERLSLEKYHSLTDGMEETLVNVFLPRFKFETKYFMKDDLMEMGMPSAFSPSADFSGIVEAGGLFIDRVIHQAFIEVNEEGTEAAAATGVSMIESAPIVEIFRADHPFIFLIQDKITGTILFMGRVMNPS